MAVATKNPRASRLAGCCATGFLLLIALLSLTNVVTAQVMDGDSMWTSDGRLNYATLGSDNRPQCANMNVVFPLSGTTGLPTDTFVSVKDGKFALGCEDFVFAGWNQWEVLELASDAPAPFRWTPQCGREHLVNVLNNAVDSGLTVVRAWAHTITEGHESMKSPGNYDENIMAGMDWFISEAARRNVKIIWALVDNWYPVGGVKSYVEWSATASRHQDFFTDDGAKKIYRDHVTYLANRVNTVTGLKYKDDPTIMAWNLANEARCQGCKNEVMQSWIEEMCTHVKSQAPNQLVGVGHEGFYGDGSGREDVNPADWAMREGQNWIENTKTPCIDYAGIHVWPDNWEFGDTTFQQTFIQEHVADAKANFPNKPLVLEEFGKVVEDGVSHSVRNMYFDAAYEVSEASASAGGPIQGTLFWHFYDEGVGPGKYGVRKSHTTWPKIEAHAEKMNSIMASRPPVC